MSKTAIIIQARLSSTRLPKKILSKIGNLTMLEHVYRRCRAAKIKELNLSVTVACPFGEEEEIFSATGIAPYPGPEKDVLTRLLSVARFEKADHLVRVTADCPFMCPRMIEQMVNHAYYSGKPVITNWKQRTFPNGLDLEVYEVPWLERFSECLLGEDDREWFAQKAVDSMRNDVVESIVNPQNLSSYRLTVDYPEDLIFANVLQRAMGNELWDCQTIVSYLEAHPMVRNMNWKYAKETGARPC